MLEAYVDPSFGLRNMSSILGYIPSLSEEMLEGEISHPNGEDAYADLLSAIHTLQPRTVNLGDVKTGKVKNDGT